MNPLLEPDYNATKVSADVLENLRKTDPLLETENAIIDRNQQGRRKPSRKKEASSWSHIGEKVVSRLKSKMPWARGIYDSTDQSSIKETKLGQVMETLVNITSLDEFVASLEEKIDTTSNNQ